MLLALQILKRINAEIEDRRAAGEDLPPPPKTAIAGPEYFGFNQAEVLISLLLCALCQVHLSICDCLISACNAVTHQVPRCSRLPVCGQLPSAY